MTIEVGYGKSSEHNKREVELICGERLEQADSSPFLLKSTEVASHLRISKSMLHRWVRAGKIECIRIERNAIYFTPEALEAFIRKHRKQYPPRNMV